MEMAKINTNSQQFLLSVLFVISIAGVFHSQQLPKNIILNPIPLSQQRLLNFKPNWVQTVAVSPFTINRFEPNSLPFFCKIEHNIEKNSKIAFRFRIGELNYVNMLENKR